MIKLAFPQEKMIFFTEDTDDSNILMKDLVQSNNVRNDFGFPYFNSEIASFTHECQDEDGVEYYYSVNRK